MIDRRSKKIIRRLELNHHFLGPAHLLGAALDECSQQLMNDRPVQRLIEHTDHDVVVTVSVHGLRRTGREND